MSTTTTDNAIEQKVAGTVVMTNGTVTRAQEQWVSDGSSIAAVVEDASDLAASSEARESGTAKPIGELWKDLGI